MAYTDPSGLWVLDDTERNFFSPYQSQREEDVQPTDVQTEMNRPQSGNITVLVNGVPTQFNTVAAASQAIQNGGIPLDHNGNPATATQPYGPGGGVLVNGQPINYLFNQQYLPGQQAALQALGGPPGPGLNVPRPPPVAPNSRTGLLEGVDFEPQSIPSIGLAEPGQISQTFSPEFTNQYTGMMNTLGEQIKQQYNYQLPTAQGARMETGGVPQPTAQSMSISPEIARMLSGEGYSPEILAQMRGRAMEDVAGAGRTELSQAKRALEQAGLSGSPAGAGIAADVARREGIAQTQARRDVDIQNANVGMENFRQGVGYQTNIGTNNMQEANRMALENANRLFAAMSQNLSNQQSANMAQFGAESQRMGNQAGATAAFLGQSGNSYQNASLAKAAGAEETNVANRNNWALNNAQLERQRQLANLNAQENRWQTGTQILGGFATNPAQYQNPGFNPIGSILGNVGTAIANNGLWRGDGTQQ